MEALQVIKTRRSIRKFLDKPVPGKIINEILEAAMFAPSAGNEQPWQFIVLDDRAIARCDPEDLRHCIHVPPVSAGDTGLQRQLA